MIDLLCLFNPGAMNFRHVMLNDLADKGLNIAVALPSDDIVIWQSQCPKIQFIPFEAFSGTSIGLLNNVKTFSSINNLLKKAKPNAVFFGNVKPNIYGGIVAHRLGIKNIYGLISGLGYAFIDEPGLKRALVKKICMLLYKISFKHFTHVFFQNSDDRDFFICHKMIKAEHSSVVNGTGVDLQVFQEKPVPKQLTFFMAARLIKEKGVFHYAEAAKVLKQKYPNVHFVLAGNIDTNPSAITEEQLQQCAEFLEYQGYCKNMVQAINNCSVFIYPSYYREGVPRALLEALACGRPVITTDEVGCKEAVIDQENGFKITSRNTASLIDAIERFIQTPSLVAEMGHKSRSLAEDKFDIHKINEAIWNKIKERV